MNCLINIPPLHGPYECFNEAIRQHRRSLANLIEGLLFEIFAKI